MEITGSLKRLTVVWRNMGKLPFEPWPFSHTSGRSYPGEEPIPDYHERILRYSLHGRLQGRSLSCSSFPQTNGELVQQPSRILDTEKDCPTRTATNTVSYLTP